jgi:hypothetical protein
LQKKALQDRILQETLCRKRLKAASSLDQAQHPHDSMHNTVLVTNLLLRLLLLQALQVQA